MLDRTEVRDSLAAYLTVVALAITGLVVVLELWRADLGVPFAYGGDALCAQLWTKGIIEHGWYLTNESVGAPFGLDMRDFPLVDSLFFLILKLIAQATSDPFRVINVYYLLTFPAAAVSALWVF